MKYNLRRVVNYSSIVNQYVQTNDSDAEEDDQVDDHVT